MEEIAAHYAGIRTGALYMQISTLLALVEKQAVDVERVFAFGRMNADILRQTAAKTDNQIAQRGCSMAADMLEELEAVIRNMCTIPPGAGRA